MDYISHINQPLERKIYWILIIVSDYENKVIIMYKEETWKPTPRPIINSVSVISYTCFGKVLLPRLNFTIIPHRYRISLWEPQFSFVGMKNRSLRTWIRLSGSKFRSKTNWSMSIFPTVRSNLIACVYFECPILFLNIFWYFFFIL